MALKGFKNSAAGEKEKQIHFPIKQWKPEWQSLAQSHVLEAQPHTNAAFQCDEHVQVPWFLDGRWKCLKTTEDFQRKTVPATFGESLLAKQCLSALVFPLRGNHHQQFPFFPVNLGISVWETAVAANYKSPGPDTGKWLLRQQQEEVEWKSLGDAAHNQAAGLGVHVCVLPIEAFVRINSPTIFLRKKDTPTETLLSSVALAQYPSVSLVKAPSGQN